MKDNKHEVSIIRSSVAEYLTFITATGESDVNAVYFDENVWLTQKMMGVLYNVGTNTINYHLKKIFTDREVDENSVIRKFRITAADGKMYNTNHYNLSAVIAVGNKVERFASQKDDFIKKYRNYLFGLSGETIFGLQNQGMLKSTKERMNRQAQERAEKLVKAAEKSKEVYATGRNC